MSKNKIIKGRPAWGPVVEGYAFVCPNSIVGWNGADVKTGIVTEKGNVHYGDSFAGKIIVMPCSRGSLGWSDMFRNSEYNGVGPIGYVFTTMDSKCGTAIFNTRRPCVADFPANCDPCKEIHDGDYDVYLSVYTGENYDCVLQLRYRIDEWTMNAYSGQTLRRSHVVSLSGGGEAVTVLFDRWWDLLPAGEEAVS